MPSHLACPEPALRKQDLQQTWEQSTRAVITVCLSLGRFCLSHQWSSWAHKGGQMETGMPKEGRNQPQPAPHNQQVSHRALPGCWLALGTGSSLPFSLPMRSVALAALSAHKCGPSSGVDHGVLHCVLPAVRIPPKTSLGFASESNTMVEGHTNHWPIPSAARWRPAPVPQVLPHHGGQTQPLKEPGTLWQCPPSCLKNPHTQNLPLPHMGSPCSQSTPPPHSRGTPHALHPGLPLLMTIPPS